MMTLIRRYQAIKSEWIRDVRVLESVLGRLELYPESATHFAVTREPSLQRNTSKIFVVHGMTKARGVRKRIYSQTWV